VAPEGADALGKIVAKTEHVDREGFSGNIIKNQRKMKCSLAEGAAAIFTRIRRKDERDYTETVLTEGRMLDLMNPLKSY
jgi:hypothetical protein